MKPLILILLLAISVEAQTIADIARQERERKANLKNVRVFTAEPPETAPATTPPASSPAASTDPAKPATAAPAPVAAPVPVPAAATLLSKSEIAAKQYAEELARLRGKVVQLQDQEVAIQLQMNDWKNQFMAPVTDTTTRAQAQAKLEQAQTQLATVQKDLAEAKRALQILEALGPPKG